MIHLYVFECLFLNRVNILLSSVKRGKKRYKPHQMSFLIKDNRESAFCEGVEIVFIKWQVESNVCTVTI